MGIGDTIYSRDGKISGKWHVMHEGHVWGVHEWVKVEDRCYKITRLWGKFRRVKIDFGRMGIIVGRIGPSKEKKDIVCVSGGGDWILWGHKERGSLYLITEGYASFLGRDKT